MTAVLMSAAPKWMIIPYQSPLDPIIETRSLTNAAYGASPGQNLTQYPVTIVSFWKDLSTLTLERGSSLRDLPDKCDVESQEIPTAGWRKAKPFDYPITLRVQRVSVMITSRHSSRCSAFRLQTGWRSHA